MRKLASVQEITELQPINGADRIVLATVLGWHVIVQKDEYKVGDKTIYVEIDSVLPEKPEFEFLRPKKFRIRTMKMKGVISQGICFPLSILPPGDYHINDDVTEVIGVKHFDEYGDHDCEEEVGAKKKSTLRTFMFKHKATRWLAKLIYLPTKRERNDFPSFVSKTDETRIQTIPWLFDSKEYMNADWIVTEKVDGQSGTFALVKKKGLFSKYEFIVCSRNRRLNTEDLSSWWSVARKYNLSNILKSIIGNNPWVCLQGEVLGPGIQGNNYELNEYQLKCFNLIYPDKNHPNDPVYNKILSPVEGKAVVEKYGLDWVPILDDKFHLPWNGDDMVKYADGKSVLNKKVDREGVVVRCAKPVFSFKAVSNKYLLKHEE